MLRLNASKGCSFTWRESPEPRTWVLREDTKGQRSIPLSPAPFVVGRSVDCQLVLPDNPALRKSTSRWHCHLLVRDGATLVSDGSLKEVPELGSKKPSNSGTWLNGRRLAKPEALRAGDTLRLGPWEFSAQECPGPALEMDELFGRVAQGTAKDIAAGGSNAGQGLALLHELFERIGRAGNADDPLALILEFATAHIAGAEIAAVILEEAGGAAEVRLAWQRGVGRLLDMRFSSALLRKIAPNQAFLLQPDIADLSKSQVAQDISSGILIRLRGDGGRAAVLYMDNRGRGEAFTEEDLYFANALAGTVSLHLLLERQAFLSRIEVNMRRYFGPDVVHMIIEESRAGKRIGLGVRDSAATVLFVDMKGFSTFGRTHSPQEVVELLNPYFQMMTRCIQAHGGHVDKFIGDSVMGVFGVRPVSEESAADSNHAAQAVRAALQMVREWSRGAAASGSSLSIRVGINSGRVVVGNIGSPGRMEYSVLGDAVNLASRLEKCANPDGVAISEATKSALGGEFLCRDGGAVEVKGFGPVRVWHVAPVAARSLEGDLARWETGQVVADIYEVTGLLGVGGMGSVYRVRHKTWDLDLAVKRPSPQVLEAAGGAERFVREAETWVNLPLHPNIVTAYYVRTLAGAPAIFAECVEGGDLLSWLRAGKIKDLPEALDVAIQVCWGMAVAQGKGLVHRDLKPANILITTHGTAKVTDFGLAKRAGGEETAPEAEDVTAQESQMHLTRVGAQVGTPAYMPPEQWAGGAVGPEADIYAFGVILYELFCARLPFEIDLKFRDAVNMVKRAEYKRMHLMEPPPDPRAFNSKVPDALADLMRRCLAKDPAKRPAAFSELAQGLGASYLAVAGQDYGRRNPGELESRAVELNNRALSMLDLGNKEEARGLLEGALKSDPHHAESLYNHAVIQWKDGEIDDTRVIKRLEEGLEAQPDNAAGAYLLGLVHLRRADPQAAQGVLSEVARSPGAGAEHSVALGDARMALGSPAEAEGDYVRALEKRPGSAEIKRRLNAAWAAQGKVAVEGGAAPIFPRMDCLRIFEGHKGYVQCVAVTPDGRQAVSAGLDKSLRLWDLASGRCLRSMGGLEITPFVALSPDGRFVLSQGIGGAISFWELATGQCVQRLEGHAKNVQALALTPDGRHAASGDEDGGVVFWDFSAASPMGLTGLKELRNDGSVRALAILPDGRQVLAGGDDGVIRVWDTTSGKIAMELRGHGKAVSTLAVADGGRLAVSGSWDDTVRVWDLSTGACLRTLAGHSVVTSVAVSPDSRRILSGGLDKTVRLWDLATGSCLRTFREHKGSVYCVAFSPDGRALSGGSDKILRYWSIAAELSPLPPAFTQFVSSEEAVATSQRVAVLRVQIVKDAQEGHWGRADSGLRRARAIAGYEKDPGLLELSDRVALKGVKKHLSSFWVHGSLRGHTEPVTAVDISPDESRVLSLGAAGTLRLWEMGTGRCVLSLAGAERKGGVVSFLQDGRHALSTGEDGALRLCDLAAGKFVRSYAAHKDRINAVATTPSGRQAVSAGEDGTLRLWDLADGRCLRVFEGHKGGVKAVAVSPDGRCAASGGDDNKVRLWDLADGRCLRVLVGHEYSVHALAFRSDTGRLISGSGDQTLRSWDPANGACLEALEDGAGIPFVQASFDGRHILSGLRGATFFRIREWGGGSPGRELDGHSKPVTCARLSRSGRYVVSGAEDALLQVWRLDWEHEFPDLAASAQLPGPYLETFLETRQGRWGERDWQMLVNEMGLQGFGAIDPKELRGNLDALTLRYPAERLGWLKRRYGSEFTA